MKTREGLLQQVWEAQDEAYELMVEYDSLPHHYGDTILFRFMRVERTFPKITILNFGMFGFPMMARPMYCKASILKLKMGNAWPLWGSLVPVRVP